MDELNAMEQLSLAEQTNRISRVVGVMSGKGGVGKSLVTGLLASALHKEGHSVGILDADITGPSIPKMFGVTDRPDASELGIFAAETESGIKVVSINLFLDRPDDAVIWRGPMIAGTIKQFWAEVLWGDLDYLLIDLPPGTADAPLTVMQSIPLDCVVIVTSPQDLAAMVVRKALSMCRQLDVPVLGLVQNMAYLDCPSCSERIYPFGKTDGDALAAGMGVPYLLDIPIDQHISRLADEGMIERYDANPFADKVLAITNSIESIARGKESRAGNESHPCSR